MMRNRLSILLFALLLMATSCISRKKTVTPPQSQAFEWMTANMSIQFEDNGMTYNDLSGQIRMRKDSLIWFNVTATMGTEVLRAKISTDSVWIVNRMEKTYLAEPIDSLSAQLGMPFNLPWIQTLLFNNNEGLPPVENQTVQLKNFALGNYSAKIRYHNIKLNEKTTFSLKITNKMERVRITKKEENKRW